MIGLFAAQRFVQLGIVLVSFYRIRWLQQLHHSLHLAADKGYKGQSPCRISTDLHPLDWMKNDESKS